MRPTHLPSPCGFGLAQKDETTAVFHLSHTFCANGPWKGDEKGFRQYEVTLAFWMSVLVGLSVLFAVAINGQVIDSQAVRC